MPHLVVLAGPNGSGKSTLYEQRICADPEFESLPFINADIIQRDEGIDNSYKAAEIAAEQRENHFRDGVSFVTESVFSHKSKLEMVRQAQRHEFNVVMMHISVENPDLSVARVHERVKEGKHDVPENKIRERYDRCGSLIRQAVLISDYGHVYDNSLPNQPPELVMAFTNGALTYMREETLPKWSSTIYAREISGYGQKS